MKTIKLNWGHKILILYLSFVGMIVLFIIKSMNQNIDLVASDYYDREIKYQAKYDRMQNSIALTTPMQIKFDRDAGNVVLSFPGNEIQEHPSGNIHFFKPDDAGADFDLKVETTDDYIQFIPVEKLKSGIWSVEVTWNANGMNYFNQERILIN